MLFSQLREVELRMQREINERRQQLLAKEETLRCGEMLLYDRPL